VGLLKLLKIFGHFFFRGAPAQYDDDALAWTRLKIFLFDAGLALAMPLFGLYSGVIFGTHEGY
jgi:hypothetical protein